MEAVTKITQFAVAELQFVHEKIINPDWDGCPSNLTNPSSKLQQFLKALVFPIEKDQIRMMFPHQDMGLASVAFPFDQRSFPPSGDSETVNGAGYWSNLASLLNMLNLHAHTTEPDMIIVQVINPHSTS